MGKEVLLCRNNVKHAFRVFQSRFNLQIVANPTRIWCNNDLQDITIAWILINAWYIFDDERIMLLKLKKQGMYVPPPDIKFIENKITWF